MAGRKILDEREARELLDQVTESGTDRATWARSHGVDPRSLNAWRLNLARREGHPARRPLRLVELVADTGHHPVVVHVRCGPFVIDVTAEVDDRLLSRVLSAVASC